MGRGQQTILANTCQVKLVINYLYKPSDKPSLQIISQNQLLASFECVSVRTQPTFNLSNHKRSNSFWCESCGNLEIKFEKKRVYLRKIPVDADTKGTRIYLKRYPETLI